MPNHPPRAGIPEVIFLILTNPIREYHDRYIRNEAHLAAAVEYVENNPVKAGLVASKNKWRWSSAWKRY